MSYRNNWEPPINREVVPQAFLSIDLVSAFELDEACCAPFQALIPGFQRLFRNKILPFLGAPGSLGDHPVIE